jgi:serine/threonine protein kinase
MGCVNENTVLDLLNGRLGETARVEVHAHLDGCEACRLLIVEMAQGMSGQAAGAQTLPLGGGISAIAMASTMLAEGDASVVPPSFSAGTVVAERYRLDALLGEGNTGVVWAATHLLLGRSVALKLLKTTQPDDHTRFLREAKLTAMLHHPNIVEVHDVLQFAPGACAMVMELLTGESLRARFRRERKGGLGELAHILLSIANALAAVHAQGIVHRDLKPENVFLAGAIGGRPPPVVKVLDFGLAKSLAGANGGSSYLTRTGALLGTPYYMSPEQVFAEKDIDARADFWALGVILYEGISGIRPVEGDTFGQLFRKITVGAIQPLEDVVPGVPPPLAELARGLLQRDRRSRLANIHTVIGILTPYAQA